MEAIIKQATEATSFCFLASKSVSSQFSYLDYSTIISIAYRLRCLN